MKSTFFWKVTPCTLVKSSNISDKPAQSRLQCRKICRKDRGTISLRIRIAFIPHYTASLGSGQQSLNLFSNWKLSTSSMLLSVGLGYSVWALFVLFSTPRFLRCRSPACDIVLLGLIRVPFFISTYGMFWINGFNNKIKHWPSNTPIFIVLAYYTGNMFRLIVKSSSGPYIQNTDPFDIV